LALSRDVDRIAAAGFDEFVIKPVLPSDIASLLAEGWQHVFTNGFWLIS
jgi:hypothetical protein